MLTNTTVEYYLNTTVEFYAHLILINFMFIKV